MAMTKQKRAIVSVSNDLVSDRRVDRTCMVLYSMGYNVLLVGRKRKNSLAIDCRNYKTRRIRMLFDRGPLFYAEINFKMFFYLLFHKVDLLFANDLDILLPNFLVSKFRKKPLVYDSHEYFTGVPELEGRPFVRKIWKKIEKFIFPKLGRIITVNQSIADLYEMEYHKKCIVVRNIPQMPEHVEIISRKELGIDENKKIIILQGAGINIDRGAEEAVLAMKYIENAVLYIVGDGDVLPILKISVIENNLNQKVVFIPKQTYSRLVSYTASADLGLSLDKDTNINYRYSLPNKLFDYIHAGTPVLVSPLVELKKIVLHYQIGDFIDGHDPKHIAEKINSMLNNKERLLKYRENCKFAVSELNWKNERTNLENIFKDYL